MKKLLRTLQVHFPALLETKFRILRAIRNTLKIPREDDFRALALFPDSDDALYLDVGANRGQSTDAIIMTKRNARIVLFEPNEVLIGKLLTLFRGKPNIVIHNFGLGDQNTECDLFIPFYKRYMFDGLASFVESEARDWLKNRLFFYDDRLLSVRTSRCQIKKLDDLELAPFFMKLDVQGYEYQALRGGERTLREHQPILLIEAPDHRISTYLEDFGYSRYAYKEGELIPGTSDGTNTFFLTEDKASRMDRKSRAEAVALSWSSPRRATERSANKSASSRPSFVGDVLHGAK